MACPWGHFQNRLKYWENQHLTTWSKSHTLCCVTDKVLLNLFIQNQLKACVFQENNKVNNHCEPKILVTRLTTQERSSSCARSLPWHKIQLTHTDQQEQLRSLQPKCLNSAVKCSLRCTQRVQGCVTKIILRTTPQSVDDYSKHCSQIYVNGGRRGDPKRSHHKEKKIFW